MEGLQFIYNASNLPFMTRLPKNRGITRVAGAKSLTTHLKFYLDGAGVAIFS